jgi:hypothetical protein
MREPGATECVISVAHEVSDGSRGLRGAPAEWKKTLSHYTDVA